MVDKIDSPKTVFLVYPINTIKKIRKQYSNRKKRADDPSAQKKGDQKEHDNESERSEQIKKEKQKRSLLKNTERDRHQSKIKNESSNASEKNPIDIIV